MVNLKEARFPFKHQLFRYPTGCETLVKQQCSSVAKNANFCLYYAIKNISMVHKGFFILIHGTVTLSRHVMTVEGVVGKHGLFCLTDEDQFTSLKIRAL